MPSTQSSSQTCVLALDQGTTSSRAILFGRDGRAVASSQQEFEQLYPQPGHVEHDPEAIWDSQITTAKAALSKADAENRPVAALGITNQRETTVLWDRATGKAVANAIVWQSRITTEFCKKLREDGHEATFTRKTGLLLDPYFSGTKIAYLLDTIDGLRARAERGEILFGTVDSFLLWRLTGGKVHATDVSNASRTLLFNLETLDWDDELLGILNVPRAMLPEIVPSSGIVGETDPTVLGVKLPIAGIAGDQQAATFGQACFQPGTAKNTYGTGCFLLMNTGTKPVVSEQKLLTTVGWKIGEEVTYCLEGSVLVAGAVVQWLRDQMGFIEHSSEIEQLADQVTDSDGVYFVPAFVGLGAPYWNPGGRGTIVGLTRGTTKAHLARAALESMAFQTRDVLDAMTADSGVTLKELRVDGGASANDLLMQFQSDLLGVPVHRPVVRETTALGAAYLAGLATGVWDDLSEIEANWALDREFRPTQPRSDSDGRYERWREAVRRALDWDE
ncbi:glycerol kinase GlpK [Stratiformator vulcanicus]|uniref:Glycerol kinase n=1 Tax=Stratiformator vulcanicus TaxID=2527980 RepID=A0A517QYP4_9PLAN|nr:glycerol kinase GlpK [Stratiformator vulcanicus]QDT36776.1 Glycerol kinase [Stratiformator vulcanicus]